MKFKHYNRFSSMDVMYAELKSENAPILWLAGATDVFVKGRSKNIFENHSVYDLSALTELKEINEDEEYLEIGSCVTYTQLMESGLVQSYAPILSDAASQIGAKQLRNRATIGGNIANASPAGDMLGPLTALGSFVGMDYLGERRWIQFTDLILSPGKTVLREKEFIFAIRILKLKGNTIYRFSKIGRRNALAISRLTLSIISEFIDDRNVKRLSIAVGAVFPRPVRFSDIEDIAAGKPLNDEIIESISKAVSNKILEIAGRRASTMYKQSVCYYECIRLLNEVRNEYETRVC